MKLAKEFYRRNVRTVAREMLGKILVHRTKLGVLRGRIVETEAYFGKNDPGSHAFKGITPRNAIMYKGGGVAYTYFTYGNHWMLNAVADKEGKPGAVLLRALEPIEGVEVMKKLRKTDEIENLCSGPGKLTQAMCIGREHNGMDLTGNELFLEDSKEKFSIIRTTRIGLSMGGELPLRFYVKGSKFVSRK
jgi:DNA-3-methyladenine glycosylase